MENHLTQSWLHDLEDRGTRQHNLKDHPNYWTRDTSSLISTSEISSLDIGTGASIYDNLRPALEATSQELILVTCFWARSQTLDTFNQILRALSVKGQNGGNKIRVRLCFSSSSLFQKLFHPFSVNGKVYPPSTWTETLGLPAQNELMGLDIEVKSIFFLPFSVMHPKFIIIDRKHVFLPSCNISWEDWFEGCIGMSGPIVGQFIQFWSQFWASARDRNSRLPDHIENQTAGDLQQTDVAPQLRPASTADDLSNASALPTHVPLSLTSIPTIFLLSPHHINPNFRFPWQTHAPAPPTPLNTFLLSAIKHAQQHIYIQTPNLTSPPVLHALLSALHRGINIHILTSARLMILEQLVTAGTTTSRCIKTLISKYRHLRIESRSQESLVRAEEGRPEIGSLEIEYYEPRRGGVAQGGEPAQSHLKLLVVDGELVVLGSGNLDRASWYTSQELGIAFFSRELAGTVMGALGEVLEGRKRVVFDSGGM